MDNPIISQTQIKLVFLPVRFSQRPIPPKYSFVPHPTRYPTTLSERLARQDPHISGHLAGGTQFQPDHRTATVVSSIIYHGWTQQNATMGYCRFFENAALRQISSFFNNITKTFPLKTSGSPQNIRGFPLYFKLLNL